jgi:hypothetical protein
MPCTCGALTAFPCRLHAPTHLLQALKVDAVEGVILGARARRQLRLQVVQVLRGLRGHSTDCGGGGGRRQAQLLGCLLLLLLLGM